MPSPIEDKIRQTAKRHGLDPELAVRVARQESGFKQQSVSKKGALGVMQLMPDTAKYLGIDPNDEDQNIEGGIRYLKEQLDRFGDKDKALAAYNWGPENVEEAGDNWRNVAPEETRNYVTSISGGGSKMPKNYRITDKVTGDNFVFNWAGVGKPTIEDIRKIGEERRTAKETIKQQSQPDLSLGQRFAQAIPEPVVSGLETFQKRIVEPAMTPLLPSGESIRRSVAELSESAGGIRRDIQPGITEDIYEGLIRPLSAPGIAPLAISGPAIASARPFLTRALGASIAAGAAPSIMNLPRVAETVMGTAEQPVSPEEARETLAGSAFGILGTAGALRPPSPIRYTGEEGLGTLESTPPIPPEPLQITAGQKRLTTGIETPFNIDDIVVRPPLPQLPPSSTTRPGFAVTPEGQAITTELPTRLPQREIQFQERPYELPVELEGAFEPTPRENLPVVDPSTTALEKMLPPIEPIVTLGEEYPGPRTPAQKGTFTRLGKLPEKQVTEEIPKIQEEPKVEFTPDRIKETLQKVQEPLEEKLAKIKSRMAEIQGPKEEISRLEKTLRGEIQEREKVGVSPTGFERRVPKAPEVPKKVSTLQESLNKIKQASEKMKSKKANKEYQDSLDQVTNESTARIAAKKGIESRIDAETIMEDLADRSGLTESQVRKIVNMESKKGEAGFLSFSGKVSERLRTTKERTKDPTAKKIVEDIEKNLNDFKPSFVTSYMKGPEFVIGERMGEGGKKLKVLLDRAQQQSAEVVGEAKSKYKQSDIPKLSKEEFDNLHQVIVAGAKPFNQKVQNAYNSWVEINRNLAKSATDAGLRLRTREGKEVPFQEYKPEKYFPRYPTEAARAGRESVITQIMREQKTTRAKATDIMNDPKSPYFSRAQRQRIMPEEKAQYKIEPDVLVRHIEDLGHRVGLARELGPRDIYGKKIDSLIEEIRIDKGEAAADTALETLKVFTRPEFKRRSGGEQRFRNLLSTTAVARYLPAFFWNNLSNSLLIPAKGTPSGILRGTAKYLFTMEQARQRQLTSGSLEQLSRQEYAPAKNIVSSTVGRTIDFSERNIRTWAGEVGRETASDIFSTLKKGGLRKGTEATMKRRLTNFIYEDANNVLKQNSLTEAQLRKASFEMVKSTQGIVSPLSIPRKFQTDNFLVDQMMMFKRYAGIQTGNMIRAYKENPTKFVATMTVIAPLLGEIVGDGLATMKGTIAGTITDDTVRNALERELGEERGKFIAQSLKRTFGMDEKSAALAGRFIDNLNRSFALGLVGDFLGRMISGPREATTGLFPGIDIFTEFIYDMLRLLSVGSEDVTLEEAAEPLKKSIIRSTPIAGSTVTRSMEESEKKSVPFRSFAFPAP